MSEFENNSSETESQTDGQTDGSSDSQVEGEESFSFEEEKPRSNTAVLFLGLLIVGGGTLYVMRMKGGPKPAAASVETTTAKETIDQFMTDGDKSISAMREMLKNTEQIVQQFVRYPTMPDVDLITNPFKLGKDRPDKAAEDEAAKVRRLAAEKEAEKQEVLKAAGNLRVQSILNGRTPTCMINSKMYVEGQEVGGFTLEKIKADSVIVKHKEYRFELKINKDMH